VESLTSIDPRTLAKIQGLRLRARHIVEGYVAGLHRSPYHGFSIEFAEHREYAPGDDLRYVDWKVFGRTDKVYLKQYEDETNLLCYLVLDVSESMTYKSAGAALEITPMRYPQPDSGNGGSKITTAEATWATRASLGKMELGNHSIAAKEAHDAVFSPRCLS